MDILRLKKLNHSKEDIEQAIRHLNLELRGKIKVENVNLELIFIKTVLKSMEIDKIILGAWDIERKKGPKWR